MLLLILLVLLAAVVFGLGTLAFAAKWALIIAIIVLAVGFLTGRRYWR
jgi:hypothetical protein